MYTFTVYLSPSRDDPCRSIFTIFHESVTHVPLLPSSTNWYRYKLAVMLTRTGHARTRTRLARTMIRTRT